MSAIETMKVKVLFFGATAAEAGTRALDLSLDDQSNTGHALDRVLERFPRLAGHSLLFAVNQEYVSKSTPLNSGDELAIFTAVSGG